MWRACVFYCDFCPLSASVASLNHNSWWLLKETEQLVGETLLFFSCEISEAAMKTSDLVYCAFLLGVSIFYKQIWNLYDRQITIFVFCSPWMLVIWSLIVMKTNDKISWVICLKLCTGEIVVHTIFMWTVMIVPKYQSGWKIVELDTSDKWVAQSVRFFAECSHDIFKIVWWSNYIYVFNVNCERL